MSLVTTLAKYTLLSASCVILAACATQESAPAISYDGLTLVSDSKYSQVYKKPGADITDYKEFGLAPCSVAFKKNWMRDQNRDHIDLSSRVSQKDVDKIKGELATACDEKFKEALLEEPAYALVDVVAAEHSVVILRPAIINLDVAAPDVMHAGMSRTYTTSAGEMTLVLEVVDGATGEVLARAIDRERDMESSRMQWSSSVSNKADADRILRRWAEQLRKALDKARGA